MSIFEKATRQRLRFKTKKGLVSVEDLWSLPLSSTTGNDCLDSLAVEISKRLRNTEMISFVNASTPKSIEDTLRLDILKHIIGVRLEEAAANKKQRENKARREQLLNIKAQREMSAMMEMSREDLEAEIAKLS